MNFPSGIGLQLRRFSLGSLAAWLAFACMARAAQLSTNRAIVTVVQDAGATSLFIPETPTVRSMFDRALRAHTGQPDLTAAWRTLVGSNEVIGLKVCSSPGPVSGTRPAVVEAIIQSLLAAGHAPEKIVIWDKRGFDLRAGGWNALADRLGVRCLSAAGVGWDSNRYYDNPLLGRPLFDELEFNRKDEGVGRRSHLSRLLTQDITRIISVAPVLNHNLAGVNGHLLGLGLGAFDNTLRFEGAIAPLAEVMPDLVNQPEIYDHLALCVSDALICQYRGEERTLLHYAVPLNELRLSKDPVALDTLAFVDIENARKGNPTDGEKSVKTELYENAELLELGVSELKRIEVKRVP